MKVRVSVANLAWFARREGVEQSYAFGILNPKKLAKGEHQLMALGGAAMLTADGKNLLEAQVGASGFEFDQKTGFFDARFQVDEAKLESVFFHFEHYAALEIDPTLDIMHELTGREFTGYGAILTDELAQQVLVRPVAIVRQAPSEAGADTSSRASADLPTRRMFRIHELVMPEKVFDRFLSSRMVRLLNREELATTNGGSTAGRSDAGYPIQNNLFIPA